MQSEEFDDKIRGAAEHHHPPYDEQAWNKMETLLDKHMPQEKEKRRGFLFFLLLFLLLGTGAILIATKPWEKNKPLAQQSIGNEQRATDNRQEATGNGQPTTGNKQQEIGNSQPTTGNQQQAIDNGQSTTGNSPSTTLENKTNTSTIDIEVKENKIAKEEKITGNSLIPQKKKDNVPVVDVVAGKTKRRKENSTTVNPVSMAIQTTQPSVKLQGDNKKEEEYTNVSVTNTPVPSQPMAASVDKITLADSTNAAINEQDKKADETKTEKDTEPAVATKKAGIRKPNSLFFTLSIGPDISFAGSDKAGKAKLLTGLGVGYTFNNKLTLRTGFYSSRKIYSAAPEAYHAPAEFYMYYPYLQKIDADCKVYEIPFSVSYHFGKSAKQNWFLSTGLSSYLMKSEVYNYDYKTTPYGPTQKGQWTVTNENKHFFSVVTLSGGYQRQLNKNISFMVEPYYKLPLAGVGYGKVKLKSAGILFSIGIKPFAATKKGK